MPSMMPIPKVQFLDDNGNPLSGGKVYTYDAGTSQPKATYTDSGGQTANANPVILDSRGEANIWLSGYYKIVVKDSSDVQIYEVDNVSSMAETTISLSEWSSPGHTVSYVGATQFSVPGDETATYQAGRRVKCVVSAGTVYGEITASSYSAGTTTVTVTLDSGSLDSGLSDVDAGLLTVTNPSVPRIKYPVTDGTARNQAASVGQVQDGGLMSKDDTGTADAYVVTLSPAPTALVNGMYLLTKIANANTTTTPTLNVNGLGAKTIKKLGGAALSAGDLPAGGHALFRYDGTYFLLLNPVIHDHSDTANGGRVKGQIIQTVFTDGNLAVNPNFDTDTVWNKGTGWTISGGKANKAAGTAADIYQSNVVDQDNVAYVVTFNISGMTAGTITPKIGSSAGTGRTANGTYTENITSPVSGPHNLIFSADASFDGSIDAVFIHRITGTTTVPNDDTIPQKTEGDEYLRAPITPTKSTNILRIDVNIFMSHSFGGDACAALFQDSGADAIACGARGMFSAASPTPIHFTHLMIAGTTSAIAFKVRVGTSSAGTTTFNGVSGARRYGGVLVSNMTITEIQT